MLQPWALLAAANQFLRTSYIAFFNAHFAREAQEPGTAFTTCRRADLELVFALHYERTVARDNTVEYGNRVLQIEKTKWRFSLAGCKVTVYKHADQTLSIGYGPHIVGRYDDTGKPLPAITAARRSCNQAARREARGAKSKPAVEMPPPRKATKRVASHRGLEKSRSTAA